MALDKTDPFPNLPRRSFAGPKCENKIVAGLKEAVQVVKGKAEPARSTTVLVEKRAKVELAGRGRKKPPTAIAGSKRPPEPGEPILVRLQKELLAKLDAYRRDTQGLGVPELSRPEAIRRLIERGLK